MALTRPLLWLTPLAPIKPLGRELPLDALWLLILPVLGPVLLHGWRTFAAAIEGEGFDLARHKDRLLTRIVPGQCALLAVGLVHVLAVRLNGHGPGVAFSLGPIDLATALLGMGLAVLLTAMGFTLERGTPPVQLSGRGWRRASGLLFTLGLLSLVAVRFDVRHEVLLRAFAADPAGNTERPAPADEAVRRKLEALSACAALTPPDAGCVAAARAVAALSFAPSTVPPPLRLVGAFATIEPFISPAWRDAAHRLRVWPTVAAEVAATLVAQGDVDGAMEFCVGTVAGQHRLAETGGLWAGAGDQLGALVPPCGAALARAGEPALRRALDAWGRPRQRGIGWESSYLCQMIGAAWILTDEELVELPPGLTPLLRSQRLALPKRLAWLGPLSVHQWRLSNKVDCVDRSKRSDGSRALLHTAAAVRLFELKTGLVPIDAAELDAAGLALPKEMSGDVWWTVGDGGLRLGLAGDRRPLLVLPTGK